MRKTLASSASWAKTSLQEGGIMHYLALTIGWGTLISVFM